MPKGYRMSRPDNWQEIFLEALAEVPNVKLAAQKAGISYKFAYDQRKEDKAFGEAWDIALREAYSATVDLVYQRAFVGVERTRINKKTGETETYMTEPSDVLAMFYLNGMTPLMPELFNFKRGSDGAGGSGPVSVTVNLGTTTWSPDKKSIAAPPEVVTIEGQAAEPAPLPEEPPMEETEQDFVDDGDNLRGKMIG